jgi:WD40 repeat protein
MVLVFFTSYNYLRSEESDTLWTRELGGNGKGNIINAIFSPDDNSIFVTTTERFYEVNTLNGTVIREIPEIRGAKYLSSDGRYAYTYDLKKVDMLTKLTFGDFKSPLLPWYYYDFDVCENANMYVGIVKHAIQFPFPDSTIGIFDTQTFQLKKIIQLPKNYMEKVAISPDGKFIATNSLYEPNVQVEGDEVFITTIWDGTTYEKIKQLQLGGSNLLKFSPDGKYLGVGGGTRLYLYNTETWQLVDTYTIIDRTQIVSFTFTIDSKRLYLGGANRKIELYDILNASLIKQFSPNVYPIDIIISTKGGYFVSFSNNYLRLFENYPTWIDNKIYQDILFYPNPASDYIEISIPDITNHTLKGVVETGQEKIQIFNTLGIEVSSAGEGVNEVDGGGYRIDISNLPVGVYFIKIGDRVEKFVKM